MGEFEFDPTVEQLLIETEEILKAVADLRQKMLGAIEVVEFADYLTAEERGASRMRRVANRLESLEEILQSHAAAVWADLGLDAPADGCAQFDIQNQ